MNSQYPNQQTFANQQKVAEMYKCFKYAVDTNRIKLFRTSLVNYKSFLNPITLSNFLLSILFLESISDKIINFQRILN